MANAEVVLEKAHQLAEAGRHAEVVAHLGQRPREVLAESPTACLLLGTAHARCGEHEEGIRWIELAMERARQRKEWSMETRALNARGGIAFVTGKVDEAADYFTRALIAASRDGDHITIGKCSNNLGSVNNLKGRHAEGLASYEMAMAAFRRAEVSRGVAEAAHNAAIAYREQQDLDRALHHATIAYDQASETGDESLIAWTLRGQAEIYVVRGELGIARHQMEKVQAIHQELGHAVQEPEDLRVLAAIQVAEGDVELAEQTLRDVIARAEAHGRPHVVAEATRDRAHVLHQLGRADQAMQTAQEAIDLFKTLGADGQVRKLDDQQWGYPEASELRRALKPLHEAQRLADAGEYARLAAYLDELPAVELEHSPALALMNGIAHTRLGQLDTGWQWTVIALSRARVLGDRKIEVRALNVYGAIALERGGLDEARGFFMRAQAEAMRHGDLATVGRAANNLGIVANLQGDHARAVGAYTMAIAAYQRAGHARGAVESQHNLGITHREQGNLNQAMRAADLAVQDAEMFGDRALQAQTMAGRAEVRLAANESALAAREAERALAMHRELEDDVGQTEDMRVLANALAAGGQTEDAIIMLGEVIERAMQHSRLVLQAVALRDLAVLFDRVGRPRDAEAAAERAREAFERLGAKGQVERMESVLARLTGCAA